MAEEYVCSLNDFFLKKAKDELHEDPKNRMGAVETFRNWIQSQKHLRCPTDTKFLLRFLRVAKFSQLVAREYLTNYLSLMTKYPDYFTNIDMADEKIQAFLSSGYAVHPEKRDPLGRQYVIARAGVLDPEFKKYDKVALYKAFFGMLIYTQSFEENQVAGFTYFFDFTGFSLSHSKVWTLEEMKLSGKMWNKCMPARFKELHYYNVGPIAESVFELFKPFMTKKQKERMRMHGNNMEEIYKVISKESLPVEYLPDDYDGPNAGTIQELADSMKKQLLDPKVREQIRYETDPKVCWIDLNEAKTSNEPQESFRRLNID